MTEPADRFGLPAPLTLLGNTPAEWQQRETAVRRVLADAFAAAVRQLGEHQARQLWKEAVPKHKPGRRRGSDDPEYDEFVLALYAYAESLGKIPGRRLPQHVADTLRRGGRSPMTQASSLATHIRRLIAKRDAARRSERDSGVLTSKTLLG